MKYAANNACIVVLNEPTDEALAERVQKGDTAAFALLMHRYEAKIATYARRFLFGYDDIQDLVQEVFIKVYVNIQSFDSTRTFSPWIYRIAHNEFITVIKKRGRERVSSFDPDTIFPHLGYEEHYERDADRAFLRKMLDACIDLLGPKYREPLVLYYFEELDYREIADILQIPTSTVGIRLKRGREILQKTFTERYPSYEH